MARASKSVMGVSAGAPRPTRRAIWLALLYLGVPIVSLGVLVDLVIWVAGKLVWGTCIGLWCMI